MEGVFRESKLIPQLREIRDRFGYLPAEELEELSYRLKIPISQVYGVATFYNLPLSPSGKNLIMPCRGTTCHVMGGARVLRAIKKALGIKEGETTSDGKFALKSVACTGACSLAPTMMVNKEVYGKLTPEKALRIILNPEEK